MMYLIISYTLTLKYIYIYIYISSSILNCNSVIIIELIYVIFPKYKWYVIYLFIYSLLTSKCYLKWTYSLRLNNEIYVIQRISYGNEFQLFGTITEKADSEYTLNICHRYIVLHQLHDVALPTGFVRTLNNNRLN